MVDLADYEITILEMIESMDRQGFVEEVKKSTKKRKEFSEMVDKFINMYGYNPEFLNEIEVRKIANSILDEEYGHEFEGF